MSETALIASAGGVRWEVQPGYRDLLLGPQGLRLDEWLREGKARVVKQGPHRVVYFLDLPGLRAYLKHYRLHDTRARLRELVRPSKARMEWERTLAVAARGVPTFELIALGERGNRLRPGDSFLLTRALEETESLQTFLERLPPRAARLRQRLAVALGELLARMHDTGIRHNDLHAGNLLVRVEDDRPALFLIDLHAVTVGHPLGRWARRANLVMLNRWFSLRAGRSDRLRFWHAYVRASRQRLDEASARQLESDTLTSNLRFWDHRDRRCLETNRYYRRIRTPAVLAHTVTDLPPEVIQPLLSDPDEPFRRPGVVFLKDSRSSTVAELELSINGSPRRVIYKRFRITTPSDPWAALVRRTPALRSWVYGQGLRERLLPTPRPLAVLHRRRHGLLYEGYLLTEKMEGARDLRAFVDEIASRSLLHSLIEQVARLVRDLHARQLSHRDLKASNILVAPSVLSTQYCLWLIDLVGIARHLPPTRRVQNLARLNASFHQHPALTRTDRLRFLRVYLQWGLFGRESWKSWWRSVEQGTRAKIARNRRTGRQLS